MFSSSSARFFFRTVSVLAMLMALLPAVACSTQDEVQGEDIDSLGLVWEAWDAIEANYAAPDAIDRDTVAGGAMRRILDMGDISPYPFLTDIGRMRGQVPAGVPAPLSDVWRATRVYLQDNPGIEGDQIAHTLVQGMLDGLPGPSAAFLTAEQLPEAQDQLERNLRGSYLGIGANVVAQNGEILLFPFTDSPAEKAGIEQGDSLLAVDGVPVGDATPSEVGDRVRGPAGTKVLLRLQRPTESEPLELEVFRGNVELDTVASQLVQGGIGYVRIFRFRENTGDQVFEALERLKRFDMLALILDLRRNPGGDAAAASEVAAQFLPPGAIFRHIQDREGIREAQTVSEDVDILSIDELPVAVLVDSRTMGEAEALAAALQQAGRADVVGVPTFGEGSGYDFVELSDGSVIYIPTSRWFTPDGRWVGDRPVQPDQYVEYEEVPLGVGGERQFNSAYQLLDEQLPLFR